MTVQTDTESPAEQIFQWLERAAQGQGTVIREVFSASDISNAFPENTGAIWLVTLEDVAVDWAALCDAHFDTLFGGTNVLENTGVCKVTFLFRQDTRKLVGVYISAMEGASALEGTILLDAASKSPCVDSSNLERCLGSAPLTEEWEILG